MNSKLAYDYDLEKIMAKIPKREERLIRSKLESLIVDPRQTGAIKLKGHSAYRVKCDKYRIIYEIKDKELVVLIIDIDARKDIYRGL